MIGDKMSTEIELTAEKEDLATHEIIRMGFENGLIKCEPGHCTHDYQDLHELQCSCRYSVDDYEGKGKIKPGDTIRWCYFNLVEREKVADMDEATSRATKIYTIKTSVIQDVKEGLIPMKDAGWYRLDTQSQIDILEALQDETFKDEPKTITFLGQYTGQSRNTIYRACQGLQRLGLIHRHKDLSYSCVINYQIVGWFWQPSKK